MKLISFGACILVAIVLGDFCAFLSADAQNASLTVEPAASDFGAHDIGTTTPKTLVVRNNGAAPADVSITLSGKTPNDFSWSSACLSNLPLGSKCDVSVFFSPLSITKPEGREVQLVISDGRGTPQTVKLMGSATQNLGVSPTSLNFEGHLVGTLRAPRTLVVTNYSESTLTGIAVSVTGDFTENHVKCEKIAPGASCAISVAFSPKVPGFTNGSLTVTADQSSIGKLPRVVLLQGNALTQCNVVALSFWSQSVWLVVLIAGLYFLGLVLVRWHMIAKPARAQLVTEINAVRSRLIAETAGLSKSAELDGRVARIHYLLDWALYPFKNKHFPVAKKDDGNEQSYLPGWFPWYTRLFNALFWPRGQELAGWSCAHEAELELVALLSAERVRARMETAEQQLRMLNTPGALSLADHLHDAVSGASSSVPLERWRALLAEALSLIYERGDTDYFQLAAWHSKMIWLVGCALLFIFALAATLQNAILLLLGAVGGLLSRLARTISSAEVANDYGASWGALFLSPLSGALSAWGGILLIILGLKFNILGTAVNVDWCNPYDPATLAIALLFGFSERLFDGVASQIENKFLRTAPPTPPPSSNKTAPSIVSLDPPKASIGKPVTFTVRGANFLSGSAATVTDERGNPAPAKLEFQDSTTVLVTATLTGEKAFTSILTITNPAKQSATFRFDVV